MTIVEMLRKNPLFADFDPADLETLGRSFERQSVKAGATLAREGEQSDRFFLVESGKVKVSKQAEVVELGPGAHFGEIGVLLEGPRTATVNAAIDCTVLSLSVEALDAVLVASPHAAAMFLRALAISLAERLRTTTDDVSFLKAKAGR
ncbi:MAG TPA: cyclic nucleotide-binding domain-containing protein [Myxococcales bacterium]|jgi:CRP-like cAMP-binding protein